MFFVELLPATAQNNIWTSKTQTWYCPVCTMPKILVWAHHKLLSFQTYMVSNAQMTTWQTNPPEKKDLVMSNVSSVVEAILGIARDVRWSIKSYRNMPTTPFETVHSYRTNQTYLYTQLGVTYAQITKHNFCASTKVVQEPHTNKPYQQTSDMLELKNSMKSKDVGYPSTQRYFRSFYY
jgi:hypothetical protein